MAPGPPSPALLLSQGPGLGVFQGCTVNTEEQCFDAVDGNCNGLIDEGCGVPASPVAFYMAWEDGTADVDLEVAGPSGELGTTSTPSADGLVRSMDCPADVRCQGRGYEVVYMVPNPNTKAADADGATALGVEGARNEPGSQSTKGQYLVTARLESLGDQPDAVDVTVGVTLGRVTHWRRFHLGAPGDTESLTIGP